MSLDREERLRSHSGSPTILERLWKHTPDGIFVVNRDGRFIDVNQSGCESLGYTRDEVLTLSVWDMDPSWDAPRWQRFFGEVPPGEMRTLEAQHTRKDGSTFPIEVHTGLFELDGTQCVLGIVRDITERRLAAQRLRASEERFSALLENAGDGIVVLDPEGRIRHVNQRICDYLGYSRDEMLALGAWDFVVDLTREGFRAMFADVQQRGPITRDGAHRRKDGSTYPTEVRICTMEFEGAWWMVALVRDVTERKRMEQQLQVSEQRQAYLQQEITTQYNVHSIVGSSRALQEVFQSVAHVAATDSTVLLTGQTGTGKELIARAIHEASRRRDQMLVKVNCAALPAGLIESELFGHEKGAFTGALARRVGRFETADRGSLLLDEIGDLPLDMQAKLLRVLQEGEFERVGGEGTIRVNVRVIAATNRDLHDAVAKGEFRSDLFYRLNVFPIHLPPLCDRREDIPALVDRFVLKANKKLGKHITTVPPDVLDALRSYAWPGNVRELENVIERAVIISPGPELRLGSWFASTGSARAPGGTQRLEEMEREHIVSVLERTGWRVSGERGAAELLGLKPTTLESRMKKLGISRSK